LARLVWVRPEALRAEVHPGAGGISTADRRVSAGRLAVADWAQRQDASVEVLRALAARLGALAPWAQPAERLLVSAQRALWFQLQARRPRDGATAARQAWLAAPPREREEFRARQAAEALQSWGRLARLGQLAQAVPSAWVRPVAPRLAQLPLGALERQRPALRLAQQGPSLPLLEPRGRRARAKQQEQRALPARRQAVPPSARPPSSWLLLRRLLAQRAPENVSGRAQRAPDRANSSASSFL